MPDGLIETYDGYWDVGRFHGEGKLTISKRDGSVEEKIGVWVEGELNTD